MRISTMGAGLVVALSCGVFVSTGCEKAPHVDACRSLDMIEPVEVVEAGMYKDGGSVDATLKDRNGRVFQVHLNNRMMDPDRGTVTFDGKELDSKQLHALHICLKDCLKRMGDGGSGDDDHFKKHAIEGLLSPGP